MSQQGSLDLVTASGGNSTYQVESCLVKIKADHLIDEVFKVLETDLQHSRSLSAELISTPRLSSESTATLTADEDLLVAYAPASAPSTGKDRLFSGPATTSPGVETKKSELETRWERWLFRLACTSLAISIVLWAASQVYVPKPVPTVSLAPTPQPQVSAPDIEFARYMLRAMDVIERQAPAPTVTQAPPPPALPQLPAVPVASQVQMPPPVQRSLAANPPQPAIPVVRLPQPPQLAAAGSSAQAPVQPTAQPTMTAKIPAVTGPKATVHNLVGILELGDRSIALVEVNGATQRVPIGQSIGSSGWRLVQITEQKAVVERNGSVRAIYVGQQF